MDHHDPPPSTVLKKRFAAKRRLQSPNSESGELPAFAMTNGEEEKDPARQFDNDDERDQLHNPGTISEEEALPSHSQAPPSSQPVVCQTGCSDQLSSQHPLSDHTASIPTSQSHARLQRRKFASHKAREVLRELQEGNLNLVIGNEDLWYVRFLTWFQLKFISPLTPVDCSPLEARQAYVFVVTLFTAIFVWCLVAISVGMQSAIERQIWLPYGTVVSTMIAVVAYWYCRYRREVTDAIVLLLCAVIAVSLVILEAVRPSLSSAPVMMMCFVIPLMMLLKSKKSVFVLLLGGFVSTITVQAIQLAAPGQLSLETVDRRDLIFGTTKAIFFLSVLVEVSLLNAALRGAKEDAIETTKLVEQVAAKLVTYDTDAAATLIEEHRGLIPSRLVACFLILIRSLRAYRPFLPASVLLAEEHERTPTGLDQPIISQPANLQSEPLHYITDTSREAFSDQPTSTSNDRTSTNNGFRAPMVQFLQLVGVLAVFDGEEFVKRPSALRSCFSLVESYGGVVEFMSFSSFIVTFGRPGSLCLASNAERAGLEFALALGSELCSSVSGSKLPQVLLHKGDAWTVIAGAAQRKWPFLGGTLVETLHLLHKASLALDSTCITSSAFGDRFEEHCCPVEIVSSHPLPSKRTTDLRIVFELFEAAEEGSQREFLKETQRCMKTAFECLMCGDADGAITSLGKIRSPSRHVQRLLRDVSVIKSQKRGVYCLRQLNWGAGGVAPRHCFLDELDGVWGSMSRPESRGLGSSTRPALSSTSRAALSTSRGSNLVQRLAERNRALVQPHEVSEASDTVTFFGPGPPAAEPTSLELTADAATATAKLNPPKKEEEEEQPCALFEMFFSPVTNEGDIATFIVDNRGRKWQRANRSYGKGAFSNVFSAMGEYGNLVAVKCVDLESRVISATAEELSLEIKTLSSLRHENIVGYIGDCLEGQYFYIVMESMPGGSLATILTRFGRLPRGAVGRYARDALRGLSYLHANGVVHCDIKPANVLIGGRGRCKLSDFGSSVNCHHRHHHHQDSHHHQNPHAQSRSVVQPCSLPEADRSNSSDAGLTNTVEHSNHSSGDPQQLVVRGTAGYMSPEACRGAVEPASDVWSLGLTVYELLMGELPWGRDLNNEARFIARLGKDETLQPDIRPLRGDDEAFDFVQTCVQRDASRRPTVEQLLRHPFLRHLSGAGDNKEDVSLCSSSSASFEGRSCPTVFAQEQSTIVAMPE